MLAGIDTDLRNTRGRLGSAQASSSEHFAQPSTLKLSSNHSPAKVSCLTLRIHQVTAAGYDAIVPFNNLIRPSPCFMIQKVREICSLRSGKELGNVTVKQ